MLHGKAQTEESLFINLTPMIDVILTLLIFFMAATKLYDWDESKLDVQVPVVSSAQPLTDAPDDIKLRVTWDGNVAYNDDVVTVSEVQRRLTAARKNYPGQGVMIRADGRVPHQKVAEVMSACHAAGIGRILFSVREVTDGSN
jgi:biopolymer transport protein ExbD